MTILVAGLATTFGILPVWLTGGMSVFMADSFGFDEQQLGFAIGAFFLASAVASIPGGQITERIGPRRAVVGGLLTSFLVLAAVAVVVQTWVQLVGALVVGGVANGVIQPAANYALARYVPARRRGFAFGLKQSAIPAATLLAGVAVPTLAVTVGWRAAFVIAGAITIGLVPLLPHWEFTKRKDVGPGPSAGRPAMSTSTLLVLTFAAGVGSAGGNALGSFLVPATVAQGVEPSAAGVLLVVGSTACISMRVLLGWWADRWAGGHLHVVAGLLLAGSVGYLTLAWSPSMVLVSLGAILAYVTGWGWAGLFTFAVVRLNESAPAAATSITQVGIYVGAVAGPSVFGSLVVWTSYGIAWLAMFAATVVAALAVVGGRMLAHRQLALR